MDVAGPTKQGLEQGGTMAYTVSSGGAIGGQYDRLSPVVVGPAAGPYVQVQPAQVSLPGPPKSTSTAYMFAIIGFLGGHQFYLGRPKFGVLYLFTGGLLVLGWLLDLCRMQMLVKQANERREFPERFENRRTLLDAYVVWMPLGIFGAHHYYLGRMSWGVAYTFTLGLFGIGWLMDGFRMKQLVQQCNERLATNRSNDDDTDKRLSECYVLAVSPLGILGAHHYYMERWMFGVIYTFTLGLFGVGWMVDLCTMPLVFERAGKIRRLEVNPDHRYVDEAYKLIFPCGFLGLHHFYLRRPGWGVLYFCTFGCLMVGWIIDFFRLPMLVREVNDAVDKEAANIQELQQRLGTRAQPVPSQGTYQPPPQYTPPSDGPYVLVHQYAPTNYNPALQPTQHGRGQTVFAAPPPYTATILPSHMDAIREEDEDAASSISASPLDVKGTPLHSSNKEIG